MGGYGMSAWTCGRCGERFEASGVVGDLRVMGWRNQHLAEHRERDRRVSISPEQREREDRFRAEVELEENERELEELRRLDGWFVEASLRMAEE